MSDLMKVLNNSLVKIRYLKKDLEKLKIALEEAGEHGKEKK